MGKGNRSRSSDNRNGRDRGDDKSGAEQSFGGRGQRFGATIGGALGQAERHADPCFAAIKGVRSVRSKIEAHEKALSASTPDFAAYLRAKREMLDLEKKLNKLPAFAEYQKTRKDMRLAVNKLNEEKPKCEKCSFGDAVRKETADKPQAIASTPPTTTATQQQVTAA